MKQFIAIVLVFAAVQLTAQSGNSGGYCSGANTSGICSQPGPPNTAGNSINDFIDCVVTTGGNTNINNCNSGCNAWYNNSLVNNYAMHCSHYLQVTPGQTITVGVQSGIIYAQGFAIWVDWNQDLAFSAGEYMDGTQTVPPPATYTTLSFVIPPNTPSGAYRMRVRCSYFTTGPNITPCGSQTFGETEDYTIYVGIQPPPNVVATVTASSNGTICAGQTISLTAVPGDPTNMTYTWTGPSSFSTTSQNPVIFNASTAMTGTYTVVGSNGNCPSSSTTSIRVVAYPQYSLTNPTPTICQGGTFFTAVTFTTSGSSSSAFTYSWFPGFWGGVLNPLSQVTQISPPPLPTTVTLANVVFTVVVTPTAHGCPITQTVTATINNPLTPTLTLPPPVCNTSQSQLLIATPGGGTWSSNQAVSQGGVFNPASALNGTSSVVYSVSAGNCIVSNTGTLYVSKFNTAALSGVLRPVCEQDAPISLNNIVLNTFTGLWTMVSSTPTMPSQNYTFVSMNTFSPAGVPTGTYNLKYKTLSTPYNGVCDDSTSYALTLFNPPIPTITAIPPLCHIAPTVQLSAIPIGGLWSQNGAVSPAGVQTPSLVSFANNTVVYTAGKGTCVASASATFHVSKFNPATLTGSIPNQCAAGNPVSLMAIVQNTNGWWSGTNVSGNLFNPGTLSTGIYSLLYTTTSTPRPNLCPDSTRITVSVLNPPVPHITQAGPFCIKGGPVQLYVTPVNSGTWTTTSYLNTMGVFSPSLAAVGLNQVEYVTGTGSCSARQAKTISIEDFVSAKITNAVPDLCNTNLPVNLQAITLNGSGYWTGPGVNGALFDPAITGAGTHTLTYHTASFPSGLCPDQDKLAVKVFSLAPPFITKAGPYCDSHAPEQLQVSPVGGFFSGANTGAITYGGLFTPAHGIVGDNVISYSITAGPCIAYAQTTISVERFLTADFESSLTAVCRNDEPIDLNSLVRNPGLWAGDPFESVSGSMFYPSKANIGENKIIHFTHSGSHSLLCPDEKSITVIVSDVPDVSIRTSTTQGCAPLDVVLNVNSNIGITEWMFGDASPPQAGYALPHTYSIPGTYSVVMNYSLNGCRTQTTLQIPIKVFEAPHADFEFSSPEVTLANPDITIYNKSTVLGNNKYHWEIEGMPQVYDLNPRITLPRIGVYNVTLTATNVQGCTDAITKRVEMKNEFMVYIPNVFTPNYDGLNDGFLPVFSEFGLDEKSYEMEIYDRWGHLVFRTREVKKAWDGRPATSSDIKQDVYLYKIKFKDLDGKAYNRTGNVTVLQ
jgi:gliding motility-associated-like protein